MPWVICYGNRLNVVALGCLELDGEAETNVLIFCCVTVCKGNLVDGLYQLMRDGGLVLLSVLPVQELRCWYLVVRFLLTSLVPVNGTSLGFLVINLTS